MKKTIIAILALTALCVSAHGKTVTLTNDAYDSAWVYVWDCQHTQWGHFASSADTSLIYDNNNPNPSSSYRKDPVFYGYTYAIVEGKQQLTSIDTLTATTLAAPTWLGKGTFGTYLAKNISITGNDNGMESNAIIDFADITTSKLEYTGGFWKYGDAIITGSLTLSGDSLNHTFFSVANMQTNNGSWNLSGFSITDANGNKLSYTTNEAEIGKAGFFWIEETEFIQGESYSVSLVAKAAAVPEPTTATLSLLALAGLAARRRRK